VVARDIELASESGTISYVVAALDAKTGTVVWQREPHRGPPPGGRHRKNTYASETPATDGERLYASFGGNVGCLHRLDDTLLWSRTWPPRPSTWTSARHRRRSSAGRVYQLQTTTASRSSPRSMRRPAVRSGTSSGPTSTPGWRRAGRRR
jgi:outer membrane protein assembly factor BamB